MQVEKPILKCLSTLMSKSRFIYIILLCSLAGTSFSQDCFYSIRGQIIDSHHEEEISYANIYVAETKSGAVSSEDGRFVLSDLCAGEYHLHISHIGCETEVLLVTLSGDTTITVSLNHTGEMLHEVRVEGEQEKRSTENVEELSRREITAKADHNLGNMLSSVLGVTTIKTGNNVSKPVIHGLYGNRISILNHGVVQAGQQWGVDHAPEIDPLSAKKITVVKGVGSVAYQGSSLGSLILIESGSIPNEPHIHGFGSYFFDMNGRGHGAHGQVEQFGKFAAWRVGATGRYSGDQSAPDYYLRNTGNREYSAFAQVEKTFGDSWKSELYASSYNTEIGIFRGSHIGNLTDLENALERDEPFYTKDEFTYEISSPYQQVNHHLAKLSLQKTYGSGSFIKATYAGQWDQRKEFDVRRGGRSTTPALALDQNSQFFEVKWRAKMGASQIETGYQYTRIDNVNDPETGILPLIPDYISDEYGGYFTFTNTGEKFKTEVGGRIDYESQRVASISNTVPREVVRYTNKMVGFNAQAGITYQPVHDYKVSFNLGSAVRNPDVNERYSQGLHQGVGAIEEGDPSLTQETSLKATLSVGGESKEKVFWEILAYAQWIDDYIYLAPQEEFRLTIRGAFPVYKYEQTPALIYGADASVIYEFSDRLNIHGTYSFTHGQNLDSDEGLPWIPPGRVKGELSYLVPEAIGFKNIEMNLNYGYVFEENHVDPELDVAPPPPGYGLLGASVSAQRSWGKTRWTFYTRGENLLNTSYRDYLNRLRYFADDLGINVVLGFKVAF